MEALATAVDPCNLQLQALCAVGKRGPASNAQNQETAFQSTDFGTSIAKAAHCGFEVHLAVLRGFEQLLWQLWLSFLGTCTCVDSSKTLFGRLPMFKGCVKV